MKPVISRSSMVCSASGCRVALVVNDRGSGGPISGIDRVTFTLILNRRTTCRVKRGAHAGERRSCVKQVKKVIRGRRSHDQYVLQLTNLRRADRPQLRTVAVDHAGNRATTTYALSVRTSGRR